MKYHRTSLLLALAVLVSVASLAPAESVTFKQKGAGLIASCPAYEAEIAEDGCMTSLKVGGAEFLNAVIGGSRGVYFYQTGIARLSAPKRTGNAITAQCDTSEIKYEFTPTGMVWTATNKSNAANILFIILDSGVRVMRNDKGELLRAPVTAEAAVSEWFCGASRLKITGSNRLWGPFYGLQVWQCDLAVGEARQITIELGPIAKEDAAKVAELMKPKVFSEPPITLLSPRAYQVFQRATKSSGTVYVAGRTKLEADAVQARVVGTATFGTIDPKWVAIPLTGRSFSGVLPAGAGGWYKVDVRAMKGDKELSAMSVENVGVGEVFVGAGQSNSTNCGEAQLQTASKKVATFDGAVWRIADDPQPGCHDGSGGGSFWPSFGDEMYARFKVPIGVAVTGHGGTSVSAWQPGGELFNWMETRILVLGRNGFRGVMWHQGESDVAMTSDMYFEQMVTMIVGSKERAGWDFPWFVAQVSYLNPQAQTFASTRDAQKRLWDEGFALEGPDTDKLGGDNRDGGGAGIHFSAKGLKEHGRVWAEKVGGWLNGILKD
ncbi:MAG: sialate O-acetylesterase [Candidatus Brocadiia bacterium]